MSRLTVAEKEHWKQRIEACITRAIEKVKANRPDRFLDIQHSLETEAHRKLGVIDKYQRVLEINQAIKLISEEKDLIETEILNHVVDPSSTHVTHRYDREQILRSRPTTAMQQVEFEIYASFPEGKQILKLMQEKESLLDTIWLATSPVQIRGLWTELAGLLGDENTGLQQQVLSKVESL